MPNLWNNSSATKVASPLLLRLTDVFVGKVLVNFGNLHVTFKLYLKTSFPSIFSASLTITLVAMFPIELLSSSNGYTCFKYNITFLISLLSGGVLVSPTYSKINISLCIFKLKVELTGKERSHIPLWVSLKPVPQVQVFVPHYLQGTSF